MIFTWDFFIAYAEPDRECGKKLYDLLSTVGHRTYFAPKKVNLGLPWPDEIKNALQQALVTVVLVSSHFDTAFHLKNEVLQAIQQMRRDRRRRVIPLYLLSASDLGNDQHILLQLQGLPLKSDSKLLEVARRLEQSLNELKKEAQFGDRIFEARSIAIVTGCDYRPEIFDREEAYKIQTTIEVEACPLAESSLRSVVFGDIWFLDHSGLSGHPNILSIGSASVNRLTGIVAESGRVVEKRSKWRIVRDLNRWAAFGDGAGDTKAAVEYFRNNFLAEFTKKAWQENL